MQGKYRLNLKYSTLLGILVAIVIFAAIPLTLHSFHSETFKGKEYAKSKTEIYHMAKIVLDRITEDLSSAYISIGVRELGNNDSFFLKPSFLGEDTEIGGRSADSLRFASGKRLVFNVYEKGGKAGIAYYVKKHEEEDGFLLYRSDSNEAIDQLEECTGGLVLCHSLHRVNFTYLDDNGRLYDAWDSSIDPTKKRLPFMVLIELEFINRSDPESPIKFMTLVSIPSARIIKKGINLTIS
jgi:hypothetical protein